MNEGEKINVQNMFAKKQQKWHSSHFLFIQPLSCGNKRINRTWNDFQCPTKWRESTLHQTLHVQVTSDTQKIQSFDRPKLPCTSWLNVNSRVWDVISNPLSLIPLTSHKCITSWLNKLIWGSHTQDKTSLLTECD